jgi:hypothetical protein
MTSDMSGTNLNIAELTTAKKPLKLPFRSRALYNELSVNPLAHVIGIQRSIP